MIYALLILLVPFMALANETYCFRVDISSFTDKELSDFTAMGITNDPDIFKQTYLLGGSSYYYTLKITPKNDVERDALLANVGNGFDLLGVYDKGESLTVKQEPKDLPFVKSIPATGTKK